MRKSILNKIKTYDKYPKAVSFTYENQQEFTTMVGGMASISIYITVGITAIYLLSIMFSKTVSSATQTFIYKNLSRSEQLHNIDINNGFAFSFNLFGLGNLILDESVGRFVLSYVVREGIPEGDEQQYKHSETIELEIEHCHPDSDFFKPIEWIPAYALRY